MFIVLMALIELGKSKINKATRWLWLALSGGLFATEAGCDISNGGNGAELTPADLPPQPDDGTIISDIVTDKIDAVGPDLGQDAQKDCLPAVFYGPPACNSNEECEKQHGPGWYCSSEQFSDGCGNTVTFWSCQPPKNDVVADEGMPLDVIPPDVPAEADVACEPGDLYGPPPCTTDEECRDKYGANWYCDQGYTIATQCGPIPWPTCAQIPVDVITPDQPVEVPDCGPATMYGPMPLYGMPACETDADCVKQGFPEGTKCVVDPCPPYMAQCVPPQK